MEEKINILDLNLDCVTVKNAMIQAIQFLDSDSIDTIEIISMNTLMEQREDEGWKKLAGELTMLLPGEAEILRAADISDRTKLKEAEEGTFLKMFIKYLDNLYKIYPSALFSILLREIAIMMDEKYPDHISNSKEIWAVGFLNGKVYRILYPNSIKSFNTFAAFRSQKEALSALGVLEGFANGLWKTRK